MLGRCVSGKSHYEAKTHYQSNMRVAVMLRLPSFLDKRENFALDLDGCYNRTPDFSLGTELVIEFLTATFPETGSSESIDKLLKKCPLFRGCLIGNRLVGFKSAAHGGGIDSLPAVNQNHGEGAEIDGVGQIFKSLKPRMAGYFVKDFPHFVVGSQSPRSHRETVA